MVLLANGSRLGEKDSFCFYCGRPMRRAAGPTPKGGTQPDIRTKDHLLPKIRGGNGSGENIRYACYGCNSDKNRLDLNEYRVVRAFRAGVIPLPAYKFAMETIQ
jgi:5-methylcytosine-specific restriction endonuclease McrA